MYLIQKHDRGLWKTVKRRCTSGRAHKAFEKMANDRGLHRIMVSRTGEVLRGQTYG